MKTHKVKTGQITTLCGLNRFDDVPMEDKMSLNAPFVTCPECLEAMGEANSKKQPNTYTSLPIQPWHFAETNNLSFLEGCIVKRVCRHRNKDGAQDLDKAIEELKLLKDHLYGY
jgi:hypothetical protein